MVTYDPRGGGNSTAAALVLVLFIVIPLATAVKNPEVRPALGLAALGIAIVVAVVAVCLLRSAANLKSDI